MGSAGGGAGPHAVRAQARYAADYAGAAGIHRSHQSGDDPDHRTFGFAAHRQAGGRSARDGPAAPARLQKTDITELDALAGSIETLSDEVLRAGGKFTQILEMASVRMGGFEVDGRDGTLFLTDQFSTYSAVRSWRAPCAAHSPSRERWMPCTSM